MTMFETLVYLLLIMKSFSVLMILVLSTPENRIVVELGSMYLNLVLNVQLDTLVHLVHLVHLVRSCPDRHFRTSWTSGQAIYNTMDKAISRTCWTCWTSRTCRTCKPQVTKKRVKKTEMDDYRMMHAKLKSASDLADKAIGYKSSDEREATATVAIYRMLYEQNEILKEICEALKELKH